MWSDVTADASSNIMYSINNNPATANDWANISGLFQYFRVNAMKIKFIPSVTADATYDYHTGYVFHSASDISFLSMTTIDRTIQFENCKVVNMQWPWKYCRKLLRITAGGEIDSRGYMAVDGAIPTQCICIIYRGNGQTNQVLGNVVVTYYVTAYGWF